MMVWISFPTMNGEIDLNLFSERTTMGFAILSVPRWDLLLWVYRDRISYRRIPLWVAVVEDHDGIWLQ